MTILDGTCSYPVQLLCANCNEIKRWEPGGDLHKNALTAPSVAREVQ